MKEVFTFDPASNRVPVTVQANHSDGKNNNDNASTAMVDTGRPTELISNGQRIRYTYDSHRRVMYKTKESVDNPDKHKRTALHLQYNANNEVSNSITASTSNKPALVITMMRLDAVLPNTVK